MSHGMPSIAAICIAQRELIEFLPHDIATSCWACGAGEIKPVRAHIVARSNGGSLDPSNFFLLCVICHKEQPDGLSKEAQLRWLRGHESQYERISRLVDPIVLAIRSKTKSKEQFERWCSDALPRAKEIMLTGLARAAGSGFEQSMQNAAWAISEDFDKWLERSERAVSK